MVHNLCPTRYNVIDVQVASFSQAGVIMSFEFYLPFQLDIPKMTKVQNND